MRENCSRDQKIKTIKALKLLLLSSYVINSKHTFISACSVFSGFIISYTCLFVCALSPVFLWEKGEIFCFYSQSPLSFKRREKLLPTFICHKYVHLCYTPSLQPSTVFIFLCRQVWRENFTRPLKRQSLTIRLSLRTRPENNNVYRKTRLSKSAVL